MQSHRRTIFYKKVTEKETSDKNKTNYIGSDLKTVITILDATKKRGYHIGSDQKNGNTISEVTKTELAIPEVIKNEYSHTKSCPKLGCSYRK